jgi:hypothetical protein
MGHGIFEPVSGRLALGADGTISSEVFGDLLAGLDELRLVVLNSCDGGRFEDRSDDSTFASTAAALIRRGLAAVVAMQTPVTDRAAIAFADGFYRGLARGAGVPEAVDEGRRAIVSEADGSPEWSAPICLTSGETAFAFRPPRTRPRPWWSTVAEIGAGALAGAAGCVLWMGWSVARARQGLNSLEITSMLLSIGLLCLAGWLVLRATADLRDGRGGGVGGWRWSASFLMVALGAAIGSGGVGLLVFVLRGLG